MSYNEDFLANLDNKLDHLAITVDNIEVTTGLAGQALPCLATKLNSD